MDEDRPDWFVGVDWASQTHHVVLIDARGRKIAERGFPHGGEGTAEMTAWIGRQDVYKRQGKGWGALSRKRYERQIDAWSDIKKNGCPEPMNSLPAGKAFPPPLTPPHEGEGG